MLADFAFSVRSLLWKDEIEDAMLITKSKRILSFITILTMESHTLLQIDKMEQIEQ
jgi:hypothetical protein